LLSFVPVTFDLYRPLKPRLRWAMQCLVSYADHAGRCFPSLRTFAVQAGISKSAAGRDLAELTEAGLITRTRRPGGVYVYQIARRFLPQWAKEQMSQHRDRYRKARQARRAERAARAVPERGTEEKPDKKNQ
jgi:DNA-binding transcriptional regulator YhcF (GntR family)